ncbi:MAG: RNA polymerase sigma factor [Chlorobiota bacterium]
MRKLSKDYSDTELVNIFRTDKELSGEAFKILYERYSPNVHAYCFKIFNDDNIADDIFQETFMRFYQNVKVQNGNINILGYLITIARNLSLNHKKKFEKVVYSDRLDLYEANYVNQDRKELLELISMALEVLDFDYREAFILREYNGLTYEEISEVTGTTLNNAKSRVFRARNKIREILKPYLKDLDKHFK